MQYQDARLSLADLTAAGVRLRPIEAVTIVREVALQVARGDVAGIPSSHVIRVAASGILTIEGPVAAGGDLVSRAAQLLELLLPPFDAVPELRAPGALRLVIARALGTLDLPPYPSLESFAAALARFAAPDPVALLRDVASTWMNAIAVQQESASGTDAAMAAAEVPEGEPAITISDIRRARRATGLTLTDVAQRSRIPVALLRQLEWGYLLNWPAGHYGRMQLLRYSRAAGVDPQLVMQAARPLLDQAERLRAAMPSAASSTAVPEVMPTGAGVAAEPAAAAEPPASAAEIILMRDVAVMSPRRRKRSTRWVAALAIPALLAIGVLIPYDARRNSTPATDSPAAATGAPAPQPSAPAVQPSTTDGAAIPAAGTDVSSAALTDSSHVTASEPATRATSGKLAPSRSASRSPGADSGDSARAEPVDLNTADRAFSPAFATEGSAMFYHAESNGRAALMRADTDSRGAVLRVTSIVNDRARNFHVRPSPDGDRIAFDSDREGERAVFIADADGSNVRRVSGEGFAAVPSWSPDGRMLAFVRAEPRRPRVWNLWTVDLQTGDVRRLTSHRVGQPWGGSWFPDGQRIAYSHERRLVVLDLEKRTERVYPAPRPGLLRTPAVSPDGRRIMFQIHRDGAWMLDLKDGSMRKVLSDPTAEEFTWAPDGRRVAYHSRRSGTWGVWVMMAR